MHPILADSIDIGLFWILVLFVGIGCAVLAFAAIFPAALGRVRPAILMTLPAIVFAIVISLVLVFYWHTSAAPPPSSPREVAEDAKMLRQTWIFFCGIPLALSFFVIVLAVICGQVRKGFAK